MLVEIEGPYKDLSDQILPYPLLDVLVSGDAPDHAFHRKLVEKFFTLPRVHKMRAYLQEVIDSYIDPFIDTGTVDFHQAVSQKIPVTVIADQLGVPREDMDKFLIWSKATVDRANTALDEQSMTAALELYGEFQRYIAAKLDEYRKNPADCILSDLVHAEIDGRRLDAVEAISIAVNLLIAGNETTTNAMSSAMVRLAADPKLQQRLRDEPSLLPSFIEECLRLDSPIQGLFRRAKVDLHIGGVDVPAGSILMLRWGAANRDPHKFSDPSAFEIGRTNGRQHIAFGYGAHFCVGSPLARSEIGVLLETVLRRMNNIRVADGEDALSYNAYYLIYGVKKLQLDFDKAPLKTSVA